jgi:hypothetical protein
MKVKSFKTVILLLAIVSFFSCKKDSSSSDYYVKFKLNGNWVTWKKVVAGELGPDLADPTKTDFGVTANDDAINNVLDISIQVNSTNFATGSYDSDNSNYWVVVSYMKDANTANMKLFDITDAPSQPPSKYIVNVTSITPTELKGTFTGNYLSDWNTGEMMNITEGEFFVKRLR